jgi:hypothetical protein
MKKILLFIFLASLIHSSEQLKYPKMYPLGFILQKHSKVKPQSENERFYQLRQRLTEEIKRLELAIVMKKEAERRHVIKIYLEPAAGKTSVLRDFYSRY